MAGPWEGGQGGTFARVLRDAVMPSSISFTFPDRGFWEPSSMLVSIPKAAWGERRIRSYLKDGRTKHRGRDGAIHLETQALAKG